MNRRQFHRDGRGNFDPGAGGFQYGSAFIGLAAGKVAAPCGGGLGAFLPLVEQHLGGITLCAGGAARLVAPVLFFLCALGVCLCATQGGLGSGEISFGLCAGSVAGFAEVAPPAAEHGHAYGGQFHDPVRLFQQVAVMAGDECATAPIAQELRDGGTAIRIKIVGGFVQQQYVGLFQQEPGDHDSCAFAAAEPV